MTVGYRSAIQINDSSGIVNETAEIPSVLTSRHMTVDDEAD